MPLIHREGGLEEHRARSVGLEGAHREFAALESDRIAAGIEAFEAEFAQPGEQAADIAIHHLVRLKLEVVGRKQRIARGEDQREIEPSGTGADDAASGEPTPRRKACALGRPVIQMIASERQPGAV